MDELQIKNIESKDAELGDLVLIMLNQGGMILGSVVGCYDYFDDEGNVDKIYRIRLDEKRCIDIAAHDIKEIKVYVATDKQEYAAKFKELHDVDLEDADGNVREFPVIMNELMVNGEWDDITAEEKAELLGMIPHDDVEMLDLLNALNMSRKRNNELHKEVIALNDDKIKATQDVIDFMMETDKKLKDIPEWSRWAFETVYKYLGIDDFLRKI